MNWPIYVQALPDRRGNCHLSAFFSITSIDPPKPAQYKHGTWRVDGTDAEGGWLMARVSPEEAKRVMAILIASQEPKAQ
jgi:hypothetical protein